jgi:hypothetical protein
MMKMMSGVVASFGVVTAGEQGRVNNRGGDFGNFFLLMQLMTMMCDGELGCNRGMRAAVGDREGTRLQSWWGTSPAQEKGRGSQIVQVRMRTKFERKIGC